MNTKQIMDLSLQLVSFAEIPQDSQIYVSGEDIKKILFAIDVGSGELLAAQKLGVDCVIAHHPVGMSAVLDFHKVVKSHSEQMVEAGVPEEEAETAVQELVQNTEIANHMKNWDQIPRLAEILGIPFMNIHNPLDVLGRRIMQETIRKRNPETVGDVIDALMTLQEFRRAQTRIALRLGRETNSAGKIVVSHGAGTNGGYAVAKTYFKYIDTLLYIHIQPQDLAKLKAEGKGNLIISGHIASDMVGINPFLSSLEKRGVEVVKLTKL